MNSTHNNGHRQKSLKEDLDELGRAYARLEQDEPPGILDQAVLNSARRAVEKKPHWMKFSWLHGLTTTAVFVLAFSLILYQSEPAPVYENDMRINESVDAQTVNGAVDLQSVRSSKKTVTDTTGKVVSELHTNEKRTTRETTSARHDYREVITISPATESPVNKLELKKQEGRALSDDADLEMDFLNGRTDPIQAELAESPLSSEDKEPKPVTTGSDAEQELLAIIRLKQIGDEDWKTELELFKQRYPDYVLPEGLTD